jgi:hypothetical protein
MSNLLRNLLIAILAFLLLVLAISFIKTAFTLLVIAVPFLAMAWAIRWLWRGGRAARKACDEETTGDFEFRRRFPRLAKLDRRIQSLETLVVDESRKGPES